ncbi:hypothetical protein O3G_MSEX009915 [Manduca sexta]|uniref:Pacifastin domain-containing protein n=1 Tax=Manduca sexta TaxID=7130 RepID=A0A921ZGU3_MANSE|nr:hypothetical protein O3G_MSEX009915 [Manduca sexta]
MYPMLIILFIIPMLHSVPLEDDMLLYWRRSDPLNCEPFTAFNVDCNKCFCSADAVAYCTKMACLKQDDLKKRKFENTIEASNDN